MLHVGIQRVADAVAHHIEGEHGHRDGKARIMNCCPAESILPHSGVGGCTPSPRKDKPAMDMMVSPMLMEPWTSSGVKAFGTTCSKMMRILLPPKAFEA